jgi:hypothetical protein
MSNARFDKNQNKMIDNEDKDIDYKENKVYQTIGLLFIQIWKNTRVNMRKNVPC